MIANTSVTPFYTPRMLDRTEQAIATGLFIFLAWRIGPSAFSEFASALLLISEGAVVVFLMLRRPTDQISTKPIDWALAAGGTFLPLAVMPDHPASTLAPFGGLLMLCGAIIHIGAKLSLNRSLGLVAANRGIKQKGLYKIVRHPMYAGYILSHVGFLIARPAALNFALYLVVWILLILRIRAEERILFCDPSYQDLAKRVPHRLVPGIY
jgi:protein-S-isoprenylcysteine O-methyltransferase Ste14